MRFISRFVNVVCVILLVCLVFFFFISNLSDKINEKSTTSKVQSVTSTSQSLNFIYLKTLRTSED